MHLNLTPSEKIVEINRLEIIRLVQNYIWLLILALFAVNLVSWLSHGQIEKTNKTVSQVQISELGLKVREINRKLDAIDKVQSLFIPWSFILNELVKTTGANITLRNLSLDQKTSLIIINGIAVSRENLLDFKTRLEALPFLKETNLPLENLLERENVSFQMTAKINFSNLP